MFEEFVGKECVVKVAEYSSCIPDKFTGVLLAYDEQVIKIQLKSSSPKCVFVQKMIIPIRNIIHFTVTEQINK